MDNKIYKYLEDIIIAIDEINLFMVERPKRYDTFCTDLCFRRAVERNIEILGEAINRILKEYPNINITNARKIVDTRNYIIHGYDSLALDILWSIVINHLPILRAEVENLLKL